MSIPATQISAWLEEAASKLQQGRGSAAHRLLRQVLNWQPQPGLARGFELWRGNQPRKAARALEEFKQEHGADFRGLQAGAHIAIQIGAIDEAIQLLQECLLLQPQLKALKKELCQLLTRRQRYEEALRWVDELLLEEPDNLELLNLKAAQLDRSGQYQPAIEILKKIVQQQSEPHHTAPAERAASLTALAMLHRTVGDQAVAIDNLQLAIDLDPDKGWPWFQLSDFKTFSFTADQVEQIRRGLEQAQKGTMNEVHFAFALGRALESLQDTDAAFEAYHRGNQARSRLAPFEMAAYQRELAATRELFSSGAFRRTPQDSIDAPESHCPVIFVMGLPRSGTTLVDQVITAHSTVDGTMELPLVNTLIRELQQRQLKRGSIPYPAPGTILDAEELHQMGQEYLQRARILRRSAPYFVDKMPFNFQHIGLIRNMLPRARLVNVWRKPMAMGFSIYRQLFRFGQDWAFDLAQIGQYYRAYEQMMHHWDQLEPGAVIHVHYEELVQSPKQSIQKLLQQLGLSEEDGCFKPHENLRPVRTASSEQVRQALYTDAIDYWQRFDQHLDPLRQALSVIPAR